MKKNQRIITASVTVLAAVATAHLMQRGSGDLSGMVPLAPAQASAMSVGSMIDAGGAAMIHPNFVTVAATLTDEPSKAVTGPDDIELLASVSVDETLAASDTSSFPDMPLPPKDALMPSPLPSHGSELRSRMAVTTPDQGNPDVPVVDESLRNAFGLSCGTILTATAGDAAMVHLTLTDPCRGEQTFTLRHEALIYTDRLDHLGSYSADIPALAADAAFEVSFEDGTLANTDASVPLVDKIDRVALFMGGKSGLEVHALEFGADYDQAGHIWAGNARDPQSAARDGGGFVTSLGDRSLPDALLAEIYTFPANTRHREGVVRLSVEAEVTAYNCGKDIEGQTVQKSAGEMAIPVTITLAVPNCDAIGEFLVLKNLLRDLKIASN